MTLYNRDFRLFDSPTADLEDFEPLFQPSPRHEVTETSLRMHDTILSRVDEQQDEQQDESASSLVTAKPRGAGAEKTLKDEHSANDKSGEVGRSQDRKAEESKEGGIGPVSMHNSAYVNNSPGAMVYSWSCRIM